MSKGGPVAGRVQLPSQAIGQELPGERLIVQTSDRRITVTNHRVQYAWAGGGNSRYLSITLDSISSCGLTTNSQPLLLVFGILAALVGVLTAVATKEGPVGLTLVAVGAVLVIAFIASRSASLLICSNGGERISLPTDGAHREQLLALLNVIDGAKIAAMERLASMGVG